MPSPNDSRNSSELDVNQININSKLDMILSNQDNILNSLRQNQEKIQKLEQENIELKETVSLLSEDVVCLEQYSRKGVMILTGYPKPENEDPVELRSKVVGMLNKVLTPDKHLNIRDFVDIHRNSKFGKNGKPPSITVKFIRYTDKNLLFNRDVTKLRKSKLPGMNFFHNMCKPLIEEQDKIKAYKHVKYVTYQGDNRHFSVCMQYDNNVSFLNYVRNFKQFIIKYNEWYESVDC